MKSTVERQYIELLISLVELNTDHYWLSTFEGLREGGYLPGGGAGSLNDWGPSYKGQLENVWFSLLYDVARFLHRGNKNPEEVNSYGKIIEKNKFRINRCLNCSQKYHHPNAFESKIAEHYYSDNLSLFAYRGRLTDLLRPENSFNNKEAINLRDSLLKEYSANQILIYNFVAHNYKCPGCEQVFDSEHEVNTLHEGSRLTKVNK